MESDALKELVLNAKVEKDAWEKVNVYQPQIEGAQ
jgi:hypothetical protein